MSDQCPTTSRELEQERFGASFALGGFPRNPPYDEPASCREAWLRGYDQAKAAENDQQMFGSGFLMVTAAGVRRLPPEAVLIDCGALLEGKTHG